MILSVAMINDGLAQIIWASRQEWIYPFTELRPTQFHRLVS